MEVDGIRCLAISTPFMVGRVNTYLIEDDPLTLLDTGPNSGKALDELERGLAALGRRIEDLGLIVVSHQHIDHMGLVSILARRSGAEVAALDALAPWLADYSQSMNDDDAFAERLMARHGIAEDVRHALRAVSSAFRAWGAAATVTRPLRDGDDPAAVVFWRPNLRAWRRMLWSAGFERVEHHGRIVLHATDGLKVPHVVHHAFK